MNHRLRYALSEILSYTKKALAGKDWENSLEIKKAILISSLAGQEGILITKKGDHLDGIIASESSYQKKMQNGVEEIVKYIPTQTFHGFNSEELKEIGVIYDKVTSQKSNSDFSWATKEAIELFLKVAQKYSQPTWVAGPILKGGLQANGKVDELGNLSQMHYFCENTDSEVVSSVPFMVIFNISKEDPYRPPFGRDEFSFQILTSGVIRNIFLLKGWRDSPEAVREYEIAAEKGIHVLTQD